MMGIQMKNIPTRKCPGEEASQEPPEENIVEDVELYRSISVMTVGVKRLDGSMALLGFSTSYGDTQSGMYRNIKVSCLDYELTKQRYTTTLQCVGSQIGQQTQLIDYRA
jgi:hypothetical protein